MKIWIATLTAVLAGTLAVAAEPPAKSSALEAWIAGITNDMAQAAAEWQAKVMPELEVELQKVWTNVQAEVDKGFIELKGLTNQVDQAVADLQQKLDAVLQSEDMARIKQGLSKLDDEAVQTAALEIAADALAQTDLAGAKLEQAMTVLSKDIEARGQLLGQYLDQGMAGLQAFSMENQALHDQTMMSLTGLVSTQEIQQLQAWFEDTEEKIDALFSTNSPAIQIDKPPDI